jgi:hypothetical protein
MIKAKLSVLILSVTNDPSLLKEETVTFPSSWGYLFMML